MKQKIKIGRYSCQIYGSEKPKQILFWFVSEREIEIISNVYEHIKKLQPRLSFALATIIVSDWNRELSPWPASAAFGKEDFGGEGTLLQKWLAEEGIPGILEFFHIKIQETKLQIGGYSLAGLFALWTFYETNLFEDVVVCSGSFWYPGWIDYVKNHIPKEGSRIYLSLGKKEEKTRNAVLSAIGDCTRELYQMYEQADEVKETMLEWNNGNHFYQEKERICKGIQWLLDEKKKII